jgi:trigger factor
MKIAIEEISPVKKAISVEIPEEIVTKEFESAYSDLNRKVRIPGFRPGKAPRALLEKRYSQSVQDDVIRRLVPDYCQRAIKEARLSPIELPAIENIQLKEKTPLTFKATVEIKPAFKLRDYQGLKIKAEKRLMKEEDLTETLEALRKKHAVLEAYPPEHKIQESDFVMMDFEGSIEGKAFEGGSGKGVMAQIGAKRLVGDFEEQLVGHKAGASVEVHVTFPPDYPNKDLAGKQADFKVFIQEIKKQNIPDLDDEFAKDMGEFSSLEELKARVRKDIEAQLEKDNERSSRQALMKELIGLNPFDVPPSMVERELRSMLGQIQSRLPEGTTLEQAKITPETVKNELEPAAREKVQGWLILDAIADQEKIDVSNSEIDASLSKMAQDMRVPAEDLKRLIISREGSLDGLAERLRHDKAMDLVAGQTVLDTK